MKKLLIVALILMGLWTAAPAAPEIGDPAIDFTVEETDLGPLTLSDYYGKVIIVLFWDSW